MIVIHKLKTACLEGFGNRIIRARSPLPAHQMIGGKAVADLHAVNIHKFEGVCGGADHTFLIPQTPDFTVHA